MHWRARRQTLRAAKTQSQADYNLTARCAGRRSPGPGDSGNTRAAARSPRRMHLGHRRVTERTPTPSFHPGGPTAGCRNAPNAIATRSGPTMVVSGDTAIRRQCCLEAGGQVLLPSAVWSGHTLVKAVSNGATPMSRVSGPTHRAGTRHSVERPRTPPGPRGRRIRHWPSRRHPPRQSGNARGKAAVFRIRFAFDRALAP
jgi:hypothetical protein